MAAFIIFSCSAYAFASSIDKCIEIVDRLEEKSTTFGMVVDDKRNIKKAVVTCEDAEKQAPGSASIKVALAKALIWQGRGDAATVRLEQIIDQDSALDIANALCATGKGSAKAVEKACAWTVDSEVKKPELGFAKANRYFEIGDGKAGLITLGKAAIEGSENARKLAAKICLAFESDSPSKAIKVANSLDSIDPPYVAAIACESAFMSSEIDEGMWDVYGWNYISAMLFFDGYEEISSALYELSKSSEEETFARAVNSATDVCLSMAGDPNDPEIGSEGVEDYEISVEQARPICEAAAYMWPENAKLHYALSRIYSLDGDESSALAAYETSTSLGYTPLNNFDPSEYSIPELVAAFYHGDSITITQIGELYKNAKFMEPIMGQEMNLFINGYMQSFLKGYVDGELFRCEEIKVTFKGGVGAALSHQRQKPALDFQRNILSGDPQAMGDMFKMMGGMIGIQETARGVNTLSMVPFLNDAVSQKWNNESAADMGARDAALFLTQTQCTNDARPLVENFEAIAKGQEMTHVDLFYLSRYEPSVGWKNFYDKCGKSAVSGTIQQQAAAEKCLCVVRNKIDTGWDDHTFMEASQSSDLYGDLVSKEENSDIREICSIN